MIPHHEQAIEMAELADGRAADPRVLDLADRIEAAQGPEIETLTGWLALQMAETEVAEGRHPDAVAMAETIRDTQAAEIAGMQQLVTELGS